MLSAVDEVIRLAWKKHYSILLIVMEKNNTTGTCNTLKFT